MNSDNSVEQRLSDQLGKDLPGISWTDIEQVVQLVLGRDVERSMDDLAASLLSSNISVGQLISALLRSEWLIAQRLIEQPENPELLKEQVRLFSDSIQHFNGLQEAIITAADKNWRSELDRERRSRVMAECKNSWHESGKVYLHNYFHEIPVSARAKFLGYEDNRVWLEVNKNVARVFSASDRMNTALISSPDRIYNLSVKVDKFVDGKLMLVIETIDPALRERRRDIRVHLAESVPLVVSNHDCEFGGEIIDLSCVGVGIVVAKGQPLAADDRIKCSFKLGDEKISGVQGAVSWTKREGHQLRAGIQFKAQSVKRESIYKFLFVQEQRIIKRLRRLDVPDWMREE